MRYSTFKRIADVVFVTCGSLLLGPFMLAAMLLIWIIDRQHPLFVQERPGKDGRLFRCYKLRTMRGGMVTSLGSLLRRLALDEVPQLFNVLKGDMSLVGPRPLLPEYLALYSAEHHQRHQLRPGITGLAQISKHRSPSWKERLDLDTEYINHVSFWLDLKILVLTLPMLVRSSPESSLPQPKFTGLHD